MTDPTVHPPVRRLAAVGWTVLFFVAGIALTLILATIMVAVIGRPPSVTTPTAQDLNVQTVAALLGFGVATVIFGRVVLKFSAADLRWAPLRQAPGGFALGLVLGIVPALVALGLSVPLGGARFLRDSGGAAEYFTVISQTALVLLPAALVEEIIFRGVGQVALARAFGRIPALVALSLLFSLAHILNPNPTPLGLINIAAAGIYLGMVFYAPGGIWTAWGAHFGWNATLAALDAPVSGLPFRIPLIDYAPGGPSWLTGGNFGPEGGLLASVALVIMTGAVWNWTRKERA
ncbi:MAG: type II CAAX endopeptidase family protein [Gemmatimonadales bacterium]